MAGQVKTNPQHDFCPPLSPPTPPPTPPPRPPAPPQIAGSLESLHDNADSPPALLPSELDMAGSPIILYFFRVPGTQDLCLSLIKPLGSTVTELDIMLALYYVRVGTQDTMVILRHGQPVARITRKMIEVFGAGFQQFSTTRHVDEKPVYWQQLNEDMKGQTHWQSPWSGHCVFEPFKPRNSLECEHSRSDVLARGASSTISSLKFNLPGFASGEKKRTSKLFERRKSALGAFVGELGHDHTRHSLPPLPPRPQAFNQRHASVPETAGDAPKLPPRLPLRSKIQGLEPPPLPPRLSANGNSTPTPSISSEATTSSVKSETSSPSLVSETNVRVAPSLLQEKLGGGFLGKTAKLGKLRIWGAGQKMLDLTVAANIYMFFKSYKIAAPAPSEDLQSHGTAVT